jgi:TIR domain
VTTSAPPGRLGNIFLSYRRRDTAHLAGRLQLVLAARFSRSTVFLDVSSIPLGVDFTTEIDDAVESCAVLLALIGPGWMDALTARTRAVSDARVTQDFVVYEIGAALRMAIPVIPVLVDGASSPRGADLPPSIAALARHNAARLDHETFTSDVEALSAAIARILERAATPDPAPSGGKAEDRDVAKQETVPDSPSATDASPQREASETMWSAPDNYESDW